MSSNAEKALDIMQNEYDRLIADGVHHINAIEFNGTDVYKLSGFSSWSRERITNALEELLSLGFVEKNVLGEYHLPE